MAVSYINTEELLNISKDVISLADDYNSEINNLFSRLTNVPTTTKEWVGEKSNYYFNYISKDKLDLIAFGNELKNIGNQLQNAAIVMDSTIKKNNNDEGNIS